MKQFVCFLFLFILSACTDEIIVKQESDVFSQGGSVNSTRSAGDGLYDLLGYGYDITGEYFTANGAKSKILDIIALKKDSPGRVDINAIPSNYGRMTSGTSAEDYTRNLTLKAKVGGGLSLFSASLSLNFSSAEHYSLKYSIAEYSSFIRMRKLYLTASTEILSNYLTDMFKEDIMTQTPDYIIKNYGTHVLSNITLGARMTVMYRSLVTSSKKTEIVEAGCSSSIGKVFNMNVDVHTDQTLVKDNAEQELIYKTEGGNPSKALIGSMNYNPENPAQIDISSWQSSCDSLNMTLIDVEPGTLIPIYDLVTDANKKSQLKEAVEKYLKENSYVDFGDPVPLYRYTFDNETWRNFTGRRGSSVQGPTIDYYYTTDFSEYGDGNDGYTYDKILCYVYPPGNHPTGTIPLYEYLLTYKPSIRNPQITKVKSYYTIDWDELKQGKGNYKYRRIACYVYAKDNNPISSVPLYFRKNPYSRISAIKPSQVDFAYDFYINIDEVPKNIVNPGRGSSDPPRVIPPEIYCYVLPILKPKN